MAGPSYDVSLVTSGHDVADARLHRLVAALHDAGLTVEVIGLGDPGTAPGPARAVRTKPRRGAAGRMRDALLGPWQARGRVILVVDPDSVPSAWVRRFTGRRVVVDVHEDYARLLDDRAWARGAAGLVARVGTALSTRLARRADVTVVADSHVPPLQARDRIVLRNVPYGGYLPAPGDPDPEPRALYVGDLRRSRGLFAMVDAVAAAPGWTLDLVGPVAASDEPELARRLAAPDLVGRVRLHGRRPPHEAWALAAGAWVGLSLLEDTPAFRDGVPSKLYEYLAAGLAVVASPLPRQAELLDAAGAGVVVDGSVEAAAALTAYADDRALLDAHRTAARTWSTGEDGLLGARDAYTDFAERVARLARA